MISIQSSLIKVRSGFFLAQSKDCVASIFAISYLSDLCQLLCRTRVTEGNEAALLGTPGKTLAQSFCKVLYILFVQFCSSPSFTLSSGRVFFKKQDICLPDHYQGRDQEKRG